ncbi:hypothetical protein K402DRAFT_446224 [Aulographum hederae CBS 113979]|uniref:Brl1/Brr6 domain-containing protein n=1 Tax=Aulographum hederae CBS 113979 TaxID=1176131 RepID=A0A6G1H1Y6_9PEZI|nr:hypothetical protein K402DRAFT_446224 [Aulographum hederae CBS 113979]
MERNSGFTPMDFTYENKVGPVDLTSPFMQINKTSDFNNASKKRNHTIFTTSPTKSHPSLREPSSTPFYFAGAPKPKPFNDPVFTTPRKPSNEILDSSGGETPTTPGNNADSEATPDTSNMGLRNKFALAMTFGRRDSFRGSGPSSPSPGKSPGKGAIPRVPYTDKAARRVEKKRSKERAAVVRRRGGKSARDDDYVTESEIEDRSLTIRRSPRKTSRHHDRDTTAGAEAEPQSNAPQASFLATLFSFLHDHPSLPHILSSYAQFILNLFLVLLTITVIWGFWSAIRSDVDNASQQASAEVLREMAICAKDYTANACHKSRVPAMETTCEEWKKCMNQDPKAVGRGRVSAHTFAEIINSFVEPISYKTMFVILLLVIGCVALSQFPLLRAPPGSHQLQGQFQHPPPTPQRQPSSGQAYTIGKNGYQYEIEPPGNAQWGLEPAPSGMAGFGGGESPGRQKQLVWEKSFH